MKYTLAIYQGTSATKAMLFNENAELVLRTSIDHKRYYPQTDWVEHDPVEILENTYKAVEQTIRTRNINWKDITSVEINNQHETVVIWDKRKGKPVYNAVVSRYNRNTGICENFIVQDMEPVVTSKAGLINSDFTGSGVKWILDNVTGVRKDAEEGHLLMGTMDSWLIWNFSNLKAHPTDYTNASHTLLLKIHTNVEFNLAKQI